MIALQHFIEHGSDRQRIPSGKILKELQKNDSSIDIESISPPPDFKLESLRIAIAAHIHYPDVLESNLGLAEFCLRAFRRAKGTSIGPYAQAVATTVLLLKAD